MTSSRSKGPVTQPPSPAGSWRRWAGCPRRGDHFVYENLDVTVTKVDHRRVLEIRVVVLDQSPDEEKTEK